MTTMTPEEVREQRMPINAISPIPRELPARPAHGTGTLQTPSTAKAPLRTNSTKIAANRDPAADMVELTRDFPALLLHQPYPASARQPLFRPTDSADAADTNDDGKPRAAKGEDTGKSSLAETEPEEKDEEEEKSSAAGEPVDARGEPLDADEMRRVDELKARDREVRAHEQAHKSAGGQYAGAVSYDYRQGPDGKRYAVGGEVSIDVSPEKDPEATIAKMRQVRAAAMAPAEPSGQDRAVAAQATQLESEARREARAEQTENAQKDGAANASARRGDADGALNYSPLNVLA